MGNVRLSQTTVSMKLFITALQCILGLAYIALLLRIWQESRMSPSLIAQAYGSMEFSELVEHTHRYLPYYAVYLFSLPLGIFMFTSYAENIKRLLAVVPFILIVIDITSMWLIWLVSPLFAWVLLTTGTLLVLTFLALFVLNLRGLWMPETGKAGA